MARFLGEIKPLPKIVFHLLQSSKFLSSYLLYLSAACSAVYWFLKKVGHPFLACCHMGVLFWQPIDRPTNNQIFHTKLWFSEALTEYSFVS
jgi:hypothetical protein